MASFDEQVDYPVGRAEPIAPASDAESHSLSPDVPSRLWPVAIASFGAIAIGLLVFRFIAITRMQERLFTFEASRTAWDEQQAERATFTEQWAALQDQHETQLADLKTQLGVSRGKFEAYTDRAGEAAEQLAKVRTDLAQVEAEVSTKQQQFNVAQISLERAVNSEATLRAEIRVLSKEKNQLETEVARLESEFQGTTNRVSQAKLENDTYIQQLQNERLDQEQKLEAIESRIKPRLATYAQLNTAKAALSGLNEEIQRKQSNLAAVESNTQALRSEAARVSGQITSTRAELVTAQRELSTVTSDASRFQRQRTALRREIEMLLREAADLRSERGADE